MGSLQQPLDVSEVFVTLLMDYLQTHLATCSNQSFHPALDTVNYIVLKIVQNLSQNS